MSNLGPLFELQIPQSDSSRGFKNGPDSNGTLEITAFPFSLALIQSNFLIFDPIFSVSPFFFESFSLNIKEDSSISLVAKVVVPLFDDLIVFQILVLEEE